MPKSLVVISAVLVLSAWLLLDDRSSLWEKLKIAVILIGVYVAIRLMQGLSLEQIISPLLK